MMTPIAPNGALLAIPYPNRAKIKQVVCWIAQRPIEEGALHAVLFLANSAHLCQYGRPIVGDTWLRGLGPGGVFGVVLSEILGCQHNPTVHRSQDGLVLWSCGRDRYETLSQSDCIVLTQARRAIDQHDGPVAQLIMATRLFGQGPVGSVVNWLDACPHDDHMLDTLLYMR